MPFVTETSEPKTWTIWWTKRGADNLVQHNQAFSHGRAIDKARKRLTHMHTDKVYLVKLPYDDVVRGQVGTKANVPTEIRNFPISQ